MASVPVQSKKPSETEGETPRIYPGEIPRYYGVMQKEIFSLQGWGLSLPVAIQSLGSSLETDLMGESLKLGDKELKETKVGTREWFGSTARAFLDNGENNLGALAIEMGNLTEAEIPDKLRNDIMGMLMNGVEISDDIAQSTGEQLTKYAILAANKGLDVSAEWGDGLARQKGVVESALGQVELLVGEERYDEARMLQKAVLMYVDSVEKLGVKDGDRIISVNRSFNGIGMEKMLTSLTSGGQADAEVQASFIRSYILCQSAYAEETAKTMPAGKNTVLKELEMARTAGKLTDAMTELHRAFFALGMASSYAQLQQQYSGISAYEKTQKPLAGGSLSQLLKNCETTLNSWDIDAYVNAQNAFMRRYGELFTKQHMEQNRTDAFLQVVSTQLMATDRYLGYVRAADGDGEVTRKLEASRKSLEKAQSILRTGGSMDDAHDAYQDAMQDRATAMEIKEPDLPQAQRAKGAGTAISESYMGRYIDLQMDVVSGILGGSWPTKDDAAVRRAELMEQSVFYISGKKLPSGYAAAQKTLWENVYAGHTADAENIADKMQSMLETQQVWKSIRQTAEGIALGFVPLVGEGLSFGWFANMAREQLVSEYRMNGSISPGSIAMSMFMVAPMGLGIAGRVLGATGRVEAAAWTTATTYVVTGGMAAAGTWGGAEDILSAAKTDDLERRHTLLLQAAFNLSMAGMAAVGGVQSMKNGGLTPAWEQIKQMRMARLQQSQSALYTNDLLTSGLQPVTAQGGVSGLTEEELPSFTITMRDKTPDANKSPSLGEALGQAGRALGSKIPVIKNTELIKGKTTTPNMDQTYFQSKAGDIWKIMGLLDRGRYAETTENASREINQEANLTGKKAEDTEAYKRLQAMEATIQTAPERVALMMKSLYYSVRQDSGYWEVMIRLYSHKSVRTTLHDEAFYSSGKVKDKDLADIIKKLEAAIETGAKKTAKGDIKLAEDAAKHKFPKKRLAAAKIARDEAVEEAKERYMEQIELESELKGSMEADDVQKIYAAAEMWGRDVGKTEGMGAAVLGPENELKDVSIPSMAVNSPQSGMTPGQQTARVGLIGAKTYRENEAVTPTSIARDWIEATKRAMAAMETGIPSVGWITDVLKAGVRSQIGTATDMESALLLTLKSPAMREAVAAHLKTLVDSGALTVEESKAIMKTFDDALAAKRPMSFENVLEDNTTLSKPTRNKIVREFEQAGSDQNLLDEVLTKNKVPEADKKAITEAFEKARKPKTFDDVLDALPQGLNLPLANLKPISNNPALNADLQTAATLNGNARSVASNTTAEASKFAGRVQKFKLKKLGKAIVAPFKFAAQYGTPYEYVKDIANARGARWRAAVRQLKTTGLLSPLIEGGITGVLITKAALKHSEEKEAIRNEFGLEELSGSSAAFLLTDLGRTLLGNLGSLSRDDFTIRLFSNSTMIKQQLHEIEQQVGLTFNPDRLGDLIKDAKQVWPVWFQENVEHRDMKAFINSRWDEWKRKGYIFEVPMCAVAYNFCREAGLTREERLQVVDFFGRQHPELLEDLIIAVAEGKLLRSEVGDVLFDYGPKNERVFAIEAFADKTKADARRAQWELPVNLAENSFLRNWDIEATKNIDASKSLAWFLVGIRNSTDNGTAELTRLNGFQFDRKTEAVYGDLRALGNRIAGSEDPVSLVDRAKAGDDNSQVFLRGIITTVAPDVITDATKRLSKKATEWDKDQAIMLVLMSRAESGDEASKKLIGGICRSVPATAQEDVPSLVDKARAGDLPEAVVAPRALGILDPRLYTDANSVRYVVQNSARSKTTNELDETGAGIYGWIRLAQKQRHLVHGKLSDLLYYEQNKDKPAMDLLPKQGQVANPKLFYDGNANTPGGYLPANATELPGYTKKAAAAYSGPRKDAKAAWYMTDDEVYNTIMQGTGTEEETAAAAPQITVAGKSAQENLDAMLDNLTVADAPGASPRPLNAAEKNNIMMVLINAAHFEAMTAEEKKNYTPDQLDLFQTCSAAATAARISVAVDSDGVITDVKIKSNPNPVYLVSLKNMKTLIPTKQ
jgi:hypothetical protein